MIEQNRLEGVDFQLQSDTIARAKLEYLPTFLREQSGS